MDKRIVNIQVRSGKTYSTGYTDLNHISNIARLHPEVKNYLDRQLFITRYSAYDFSKGNILNSVFGVSATEYIDNLNFEWNMKSTRTIPMTITKVYGTPGAKHGQYGAEIKVDVDRDYAVEGETLTFGASDKTQMVYLFRKEPKANGATYFLKTESEGANHFIKDKFIQVGQHLTRMFTLRGEASETGSHTEGHTNIGFRGSLNVQRKTFRITDFAAQARLEYAIQYSDNTVEKYWDYNLINDYRTALNKELNNQAIYGRISENPRFDPDSGYPINPSAGLLQQIEFGGAVEGYNNLSVDLIVHSLSKVIASRMDPSEVGEIVGMTGWYGALNFSRAIESAANKSGIQKEAGVFINKDKSPFSNNALTFGYQYTRYYLPNGGSFKLIYNPLYDDKSINSELDYNGIPVESQRITILDVTGQGHNKSNIVIMKKKKVAGTVLVEGAVKIDGTPNTKDAKHMGNYVDGSVMDSIGIKVIDPTITMDLVKRTA